MIAASAVDRKLRDRGEGLLAGRSTEICGMQGLGGGMAARRPIQRCRACDCKPLDTARVGITFVCDGALAVVGRRFGAEMLIKCVRRSAGGLLPLQT